MEAIGSEVGQKMRSAIKAKLMELGCYVDDELPDYVMVMVANKRTRSQMEDDLQLFLTNNTEAFVGWLHQVLQKLQEVTINKKLLSTGDKKGKQTKPVDVKKEHKTKDKKREKNKTKDKQKSKSKDKHSKKDKNKDKKQTSAEEEEDEAIRPNVPPIYMNLAKESSPSITDVFAGQILKTHGFSINSNEKDKSDSKVTVNVKKKLNRSKFPIIDPNTISQIGDKEASTSQSSHRSIDQFDVPSLSEIEKERDKLAALPREEQIKEYNEINAKIQTLKKKLAEQLESGSEDEDFINLRTEAEELIGVDLCEDLPLAPLVQPTSAVKSTSSINNSKSSPHLSEDALNRTPPPLSSDYSHLTAKRVRTPIRPPSPDRPHELPVIELNLPKRPMRDRLGVKTSFGGLSDISSVRSSTKLIDSGGTRKSDDSRDRIHSDKSPRIHSDSSGGIRNRVSRDVDRLKKDSSKEEEHASSKRRIGSRVVPLPPAPEDDGSLGNLSVASVVRAPPRPPGQPGAPASQLLLRAMADAHRSLLSMPPKTIETRKKAVVMPTRRNVDPMKIIIQVPSEHIPSNNSRNSCKDDSGDEIDMDTESLGDLENEKDGNKLDCCDNPLEYIPEPIKKSIKNRHIDYVPTHIEDTNIEVPVISRVLHLKNERQLIRKDPQFVVTLEGVNPNMFLEKKLCREIEEEKQQNSPNNVSEESSNSNNNHSNRVSNKSDPNDSPKSKSNTKPTHQHCEETKISSSRIESSHHKQADSIQSHRDDQSSEKQNSGRDGLETWDESNNRVDSGSANKIRKSVTKISFDKTESEHSKDIRTNLVDRGTKRRSDGDGGQPVKQKRCPSPIIFDKKEGDHSTTSKYSAAAPLKTPPATKTRCKFFPECVMGPACEFYHPPLSTSPSAACRAFPNCSYGDKCVYGHPPCKFDVLCTRTGCLYSHLSQKKTNKLVNSTAVPPAIASRVVPAQNYKTISAPMLPAICKFYPHCTNPGCHFFHPKPCRFGKACLNKIECNFYHHDLPTAVKYYS